MKIFIICSKVFYDRIPQIRTELEKNGHEIILPNSYDKPFAEKDAYSRGEKEHKEFKKRMFERSRNVTEDADAVFVLNFDKHGQPNYIGGATFLEMYDAFVLGKKIFLYNEIPEGILYDEIHGFSPTIIHGNLTKIF